MTEKSVQIRHGGAEHQARLGGDAALHNHGHTVDVLERKIAVGRSATGMLKVSALPFQSPSFTQRRTTLV